METEDKILIGAGILIAGYFLYNKLSNQKLNYTKQEVQNAIISSNAPAYHSQMNPGTTNIVFHDIWTGKNATYQLTQEDYNNMTNWQRLQMTLGINPFKVIV